MSKKFDAFIEEGMKSYKKASEVAALFRGEVENILKDIMNSREDWGPFQKKAMKQSQSSKFWTEFPYINANLNGAIHDTSVTIRIAVNWTDSSTKYPFYEIRFYDQNHPFVEEMKNFVWNEDFTFEEPNKVVLYPDASDISLNRDFGMLIDEFVRFISTL